MVKTTFVRGDNRYSVPIDLTCPTAKRAMVLAGVSLVLAVILSAERLVTIVKILAWHRQYREAMVQGAQRYGKKKVRTSE